MPLAPVSCSSNHDELHSAIAISLNDNNYAVADGFLPDIAPLAAVLRGLRHELAAGEVDDERVADHIARIRKQALTQQEMEKRISEHQTARNDLMRWLSPTDAVWDGPVQQVMVELNRLVAALQTSKVMYDEWDTSRTVRVREVQATCYPGHGAQYSRHVDNDCEPITSCARM